MSRHTRAAEKPAPAAGSSPLHVALVLSLFGLLAGYLYRPVQHTGDGAAYVLQALEGPMLERTVHVGYLAPLWAWTGVLGLPPNLLNVLWVGLGLLASLAAGGLLLRTQARNRRLPADGLRTHAPLLAPLSLLAALPTWEAALFVELYGPLAAVSITALWALLAQRDRTAGLLLAWAATIHPGAWAIAPGLLLLSGVGSWQRARTIALWALLPWALVVGLLFEDWWAGGRGLNSRPSFDRSPWESLQAGWRILARGMGPAAGPALAGLLVLRTRRAMGLAAVFVGTALCLDRYSDNPGQLPTMWFLACAAPAAVCWLEDLQRLRLRTAGALALPLLLALGIAEATTRQDIVSRQAERSAQELVDRGCPRPLEPGWANEQQWRLLCGVTDGLDSAPSIPRH